VERTARWRCAETQFLRPTRIASVEPFAVGDRKPRSQRVACENRALSTVRALRRHANCFGDEHVQPVQLPKRA
jgi:hypothetical protein